MEVWYLMDVFIIIIFGLLVFGVSNTVVYFFSRAHRKRMIISGILMLLLSPLVFYATLNFAALFDPGGFGSAIFALGYGYLYLLNGIIILIVQIFKLLKIRHT